MDGRRKGRQKEMSRENTKKTLALSADNVIMELTADNARKGGVS